MDGVRFPEPIATMCNEHEAILGKLTGLAGAVAEGSPNAGKIAGLLSDLLSVLEEHVNKEETLLFPAVRDALGDDAGALEVIELEHRLVSALKKELSLLASSLSDCGTQIAECMDRLGRAVTPAVDLLPAHIFKEDHLVYPLASRIIPEQTLSELSAVANGGG